MLDSKSKSWPKTIKPKLLSFKSLGLDLRITPSLSLPRATHIPPGRPKISGKSPADALFFDFRPFQNVFQNLLRKIIERNAKIEVFGFPKPSQNPPEILPKAMSQQTYDFSSIFARKMICCNNANIDFILVFTVRNGSWTILFESLLACIFGPKNLPIFFPKRSPNPLKTDAKNVMFFNIDFFRLGTRFWSFLGFHDGAKLGKNRKFRNKDRPLAAILT